jgi:O-antigen biosynthesis protein
VKPYLVHTYPWREASAGEIVLHKLAEALFKKFPEDVFVLASKQNKIKIPTLDKCKEDKEGCIGIYPEVVKGNPLQCGRAVRYLLNLPGVCGGPKEFPEEDLLFVYSKFFNNKIGLPEDRILTTPCIDIDVFYDRRLDRKGKLYYIGKGRDSGAVKVPSIGKGHDYMGEEGQKRLAYILNKCELLYSYDSVSAMYEIARLCGCPVVIMPDDKWTKEDCRSILNWDAGGVGYGLDEEAYAMATCDSSRIRKAHEDWVLLFQKQLTTFIEITQR